MACLLTLIAIGLVTLAAAQCEVSPPDLVGLRNASWQCAVSATNVSTCVFLCELGYLSNSPTMCNNVSWLPVPSCTLCIWPVCNTSFYRSGEECPGDNSTTDTQEGCSVCGWESNQTQCGNTGYVNTGDQCNGTTFTNTETCTFDSSSQYSMSGGVVAIIVVGSGLLSLVLGACAYHGVQEAKKQQEKKIGQTGVTARDKATREGVYAP
eukprot:gb/GEZN01021373.1/.p1 GENE.gb/GEZN01021373.1/~~gb/GEZN01021373.1/.p1  ORF type:complete len:209 (-),score=11.32 gb/GEZN01021373.1/:3-629(-)